MVSLGEDQLLLFVTEKKDWMVFSRGIFSELIFVNLSERIVSGYINLPGVVCPAMFLPHRWQFRITALKLTEL